MFPIGKATMGLGFAEKLWDSRSNAHGGGPGWGPRQDLHKHG